jgi:hypothetical protein
VRWWAAAFAILAVAVIARNVTALSTAPPGLYLDEASIGYNAWTIAHYGVDEHGNPLPLYFQAFGEFKNPVYVYALVPLVRLLPLTATTVRLPAALFGLLTIFFITLAAWRVSRSRWVAVLACVLAALTPWLVQESRIAFEVIGMVAALAGALWCLAGEKRSSRAQFAGAGVFLAVAIFAYSTARVEVLLFTLVFIAVFARRRFRGWWLTPSIVGVGYGLFGVWFLLHPGALTEEFTLRSIAADGAPLATLIGRFAGNYVSYFNPDFLFIHGDTNLRHNTGYAGMLAAVAAPLLLLGLVWCWRRRREALPKFVVLCLILGPAAAAAINNYGQPHSLRSADMLPFWLVLAVLGLDEARHLVRRIAPLRPGLVALVAGGLVVQGSFFLVDMYTAYPVRSAVWFDDGLAPAIAAAWHRAAGHTVFVSATFDSPSAYIYAEFALLPAPPKRPAPLDELPQIAALRIVVEDPAPIAGSIRPGDVAVLSPSDPVPPGAVNLGTMVGPVDPLRPDVPPQPLVTTYTLPQHG